MSSRGARLAIAVLFALACAAASWQYLRVERAYSMQSEAAASFERNARMLVATIAELRGAQQAYVATGQGLDYWTTRVTRDVGALRARVDSLRREVVSSDARIRLDAAAARLDDFSQMDARARQYAAAEQRFLASDLIFGDGVGMTQAIAAEIEAALSTEISVHSNATRRLRGQRQVLAGGVAGLGVLFLLIFALAPGPGRQLAPTESVQPATTLDLKSAPDDNGGELVGAAMLAFDAPAPAPLSTVDLASAADLCLDLARVRDTGEIPALLERMTRVLDARGIVLWMADPEGRELVPTVAHGYPAASLSRLGAIGRNADNATAAAYREARVHTVKGEANGNGAVVVPLITPGGCVGVMAAEVRSEQRAEVRALASILAAQLATLLGVSPVRQAHAKAN
jgi:hypothetical protein